MIGIKLSYTAAEIDERLALAEQLIQSAPVPVGYLPMATGTGTLAYTAPTAIPGLADAIFLTSLALGAR